MPSNSLIPAHGLITVANVREVFKPAHVEARLAKITDKDHEPLRAKYERMRERGPQRFAVKPSGVPDRRSLYDQMRNFGAPLDDVKRHVALSQDSREGLEVTPMLRLGPQVSAKPTLPLNLTRTC